MSGKENYSYSSFIKDIFIEVPNYKYHHHPNFGNNEGSHRFIGRDNLQERFLDILRKGSRNGAYLVTGYRGMGKTSLVNIVVDKYRDEEKGKKPSGKVSNLKISLAQSNLDESDVLRHILKLLYEEIKVDRRNAFFPYLEYHSYFLSIIFLLITLVFTPLKDLFAFGEGKNLERLAAMVTFSAFILIFLHNTIKILFEILNHFISKAFKSFQQDKDIKHEENKAKEEDFKTNENRKAAKSNNSRSEIFKYNILLLIIDIVLVSFVTFCISRLAFPEQLVDTCWFWIPTAIADLFLIYKWVQHQIRRDEDKSQLNQGITYIILRHFHHSFKLYELNKQITLLYDRSAATITKSSGDTSFLKDVINTLTGNQTQTFPIASAKEIEYELIDILDKYNFKKFIFIFDELDKVEMDIDQPMASGNLNYEQERTFLNDLRERKQVIIKVFSSMKHLLTEAKARFIFIAGREMFDASLADISDRQSALGSIFHSIFYVESFLKGIKNSNSGTKSTNLNQIEAYISNLLFVGQQNHNSSPSLYSQLWELLEQSNNDENYNELVKIMFCMQNYVTYLTYRSNGSPKKLIRLFEENMLSHKSIGIQNDLFPSTYNTSYYHSDSNKIIVFSRSPVLDTTHSRLFINFSFKQQYKFGFNAYLFLPFLFTKKSYLSNLSDGINVSTPYLMDNIIKFHPFAFSNHNLELLPELLSSNKAPELRNFIQDLIDYLEKNHIRVIDSGLFKYKFMDRIHNEVAYISRVFDEESAAFNFSQDENHPIKSHLLHKINLIRKTFKNFKKHRKASVESLTFLNDLLGDSYLFDEAFKDSIVSLVDSIHDINPVHEADANLMPIESFLLWMRIKLKISMIFDKMKFYEMAIGNLGVAMEVSVNYLSTISKNAENKQPKSILINEITPHYKELLQVTQQAILGSIYVQEKFGESITYAKLESFLKQYFIINHSNKFQKYIGRDLMTASFFAHLGILLYYKNKTLPYRTSLKVKDIILQRNNNSYDNLSKADQKKLIKELTTEIQSTPFFSIIGEDLEFSHFIIPSFLELYSAFDYKSRDFRFSLVTYICYKKALASYLAINTQHNTNNELRLPILITEALNLLKDFRNVHDTRKLVLLADSISRIGDMLFTLTNCERYKEKNILEDVIKKFNNPQGIDDFLKAGYEDSFDKAIFDNLEKKDQLTYIDYPISLFYLAGKLYVKASKNALASFQFKKILLTILRSKALENTNAQHCDHLIHFLKNTILKKILKLSSASSFGADRLQISTMKHYMGIKESTLNYKQKNAFYSQLATSADAKEGLIIMAELQLKSYEISKKYNDFNTAMKQIPEFELLKQTNSISLQSLRIMELLLQVQINTFLLTNTIRYQLMLKVKSNGDTINISLVPNPTVKVIDSYSWQEDLYPFTLMSYECSNPAITEEVYTQYISRISATCSKQRIEQFRHYTKLISNSIFCLHQAIITANIYGQNYMQGYAYLGSFHMKMGIWLKHLILCHRIRDNITDESSELMKIINQMDQDIKNLVGETSLRNIDNSLSQFQTALEYFENSIQLHSEGPVYKSQLNTLIFLEDDYGDTYNHFGAALERQAINSGKIRKNINELKKQLGYSSLFNYDCYLDTDSRNNQAQKKGDSVEPPSGK